jgi:hypothetical protein
MRLCIISLIPFTKLAEQIWKENSESKDISNLIKTRVQKLIISNLLKFDLKMFRNPKRHSKDNKVSELNNWVMLNKVLLSAVKMMMVQNQERKRSVTVTLQNILVSTQRMARISENYVINKLCQVESQDHMITCGSEYRK